MLDEESMCAESDDTLEKFSVGIVGTNADAKAIQYAFTKPHNEILIVDDIDNTIEDLAAWAPSVVFVCTDVTVGDDGVVEASDLEANVSRLKASTEAGVVIKTSLSIDLVDRICGNDQRVVYNPNIACQTDLIQERLASVMQVIGGAPKSTMALQEIYYRFSTFNIHNFAHVTPVEAAFIESSVSAFAAVKSVFFNELFDVVSEFGGDYHTISTFITSDPMVGAGESRVPNIDFGRGCNNDSVKNSVKMLTRFNERFGLLQKAKEINETYVSRKD
jgi:UDP-glucose 6-dehydrogenase